MESWFHWGLLSVKQEVNIMFEIPIKLPICLSISAASSGVARGITPGSVQLVRNNVAMTKRNNKPAITGNDQDTCKPK